MVYDDMTPVNTCRESIRQIKFMIEVMNKLKHKHICKCPNCKTEFNNPNVIIKHPPRTSDLNDTEYLTVELQCIKCGKKYRTTGQTLIETR